MLYSATTADGKPQSGYVDADNATEARERLERRGFTQVVLHQLAPVVEDAEMLDAISPHAVEQLARLQIQLMRAPTVLTMLASTARSAKWWLIVDAVMLVLGLATDTRWLWISSAILLLLPFAFTLWNYRHSARYTGLLRAFALGRWKEFEALMAQLAPMRARSQQLDFDLDVRHACLISKRGELRAAIESLEPWRERLAGQPGMFEMRLAAVFPYGGDREQFVTHMRLAHEASPTDPARAVDFALANARWGDVDKAEETLSKVDAGLLPPFAAPFVAWIEGLIALKRQRPDTIAHLARATEGFLGWSGNPAVWVSLAHCACDYALALSFAGHKAQAEATLTSVLPILRHHVDKPLMQLLRNEIAVTWTAGTAD